MSGDALTMRPEDGGSSAVFTDFLEFFAAVLVSGAPDPAAPSIVGLAARARVEARDEVRSGRLPAADDAVPYGVLYRLARERAAAVTPAGPIPSDGPRWSRAAASLGTLRHRQRAALALYYVAGLPLEGVGRALGLKEREARSVVEAGVANLVKTFGEPVDIRRALRTAGSRIVAAPMAEQLDAPPARLPRGVVRALLAPMDPPPVARRATRRSPVEALITPSVLETLEAEPPDLGPAPEVLAALKPLRPLKRDIVPARTRPPMLRRLAWAAALCVVVLATLVPAGAGDLPVQPEPPAPVEVVEPVVEASTPVVRAAVVVVRRGDSLWRIAARQLGDPLRWREIWRLNRGRTFGRATFIVPGLIETGWRLRMPPR